jgi:hypothetical protein
MLLNEQLGALPAALPTLIGRPVHARIGESSQQLTVAVIKVGMWLVSAWCTVQDQLVCRSRRCLAGRAGQPPCITSTWYREKVLLSDDDVIGRNVVFRVEWAIFFISPLPPRLLGAVQRTE